ncbi:MAG TPA: hypothetical protein VK978_03020 [Candidatus Saccharimonadales bacterium]|nr:hypothetical protein [Candidatus Saccharimonadales bacterium]
MQPAATAGMYVLAAVPVEDPVVLTPSVTRSAAAVVATMVIMTFLAFAGSGTVATVLRFATLILGIGAWIITQEWALEVGDALRGLIAKFAAFTGRGEDVAGAFFTIVVIGLIVWGLMRYRNTKGQAKGPLFLALLLGALLFTASWARELAILYADNMAVPIADGFFFVFS